MKPIIFVRVADMKYYRGITENDKPYNGGAYVRDTGYAHECYNFAPIIQEGEDFEKCLGFFMMAGGYGANQLHLENISGCKALKNENKCEGVIVVFVSKALNSKTMRVAGFYKNATVYRFRHYMEFENGYEQEYIFEAKKENCIVLPYHVRFSNKDWYVPSATSKYAQFGFGRSHIWYAGNEDASEQEKIYAENMITAVENYHGENWMGKEVM